MYDGVAYTLFCVGFDSGSLLDDWEPCSFRCYWYAIGQSVNNEMNSLIQINFL
jgi:hypothetical protein